MRKTLSLVLAVIMIASCSFILSSCGSSTVDGIAVDFDNIEFKQEATPEKANELLEEVKAIEDEDVTALWQGMYCDMNVETNGVSIIGTLKCNFADRTVAMDVNYDMAEMDMKLKCHIKGDTIYADNIEYLGQKIENKKITNDTFGISSMLDQISDCSDYIGQLSEVFSQSYEELVEAGAKIYINEVNGTKQVKFDFNEEYVKAQMGSDAQNFGAFYMMFMLDKNNNLDGFKIKMDFTVSGVATKLDITYQNYTGKIAINEGAYTEMKLSDFVA